MHSWTTKDLYERQKKMHAVLRFTCISQYVWILVSNMFISKKLQDNDDIFSFL